MYTFFVLGLIPGTDIQITFTMWLDTLALIICVLLLHYEFRNRSNAALPPTLSPETEQNITLLARQGQLIRRIAAVLPISIAGSR